MRVVSYYEMSALIRRDQTAALSPHHKKINVCKTERGCPSDTESSGTFISDFPASQREIDVVVYAIQSMVPCYRSSGWLQHPPTMHFILEIVESFFKIQIWVFFKYISMLILTIGTYKIQYNCFNVYYV